MRTVEFKYAKLSPLRIAGRDLKDSIRFVPFVSGGLQRVHAVSDDGGEHSTDDYWSPTWGVGAAFALSKKSSLSLEFEQNAGSGERRISRLELELKFAVVGDPDE